MRENHLKQLLESLARSGRVGVRYFPVLGNCYYDGLMARLRFFCLLTLNIRHMGLRRYLMVAAAAINASGHYTGRRVLEMEHSRLARPLDIKLRAWSFPTWIRGPRWSTMYVYGDHAPIDAGV